MERQDGHKQFPDQQDVFRVVPTQCMLALYQAIELFKNVQEVQGHTYSSVGTPQYIYELWEKTTMYEHVSTPLPRFFNTIESMQRQIERRFHVSEK